MIIDINVARNARSIKDSVAQHIKGTCAMSFEKNKYLVKIKVGQRPSMQTLQKLSSLPPTLNGFEVYYEVTA